MAEIRPEFWADIKGKKHPLYKGVLDAATRSGLKSLKTRVLQIPSADNGQMAVVEATAEFEDGRVFMDVGDCSPANTSPQIATAALRQASTRAKGRVLRDALNIGDTLAEEMPDDAAPAQSRPPTQQTTAYRGNAKPTVTADDGKQHVCSTPGCGVVIGPAVYKFSTEKMGKPLCFECQKKEGVPA